MADETIFLRIKGDSTDAQGDLKDLITLARRLGEQSKRSSTTATTAEKAANRERTKSIASERQRAQALRASGITYREVGRQMGISTTKARQLAVAEDRLTTSTRKATLEQGKQQRANRALGMSFGSLARRAAAVGTAYIGISQAKQAITATTDFAKASLTLTKNLDMSARSASSFAAVALARGADARSLGMGFNAISRQVEAAKKGTESAVDLFKGLGVEIDDLRSKNMDDLLPQIADGMAELGAGTERTATMSKLLGRSYATLGPMLRGGGEALREQMDSAKQLGATFSKLGLKDMEDVIAAQRRMKLAQLGLQVSFTQLLTPAIEGASDKLADLSQILNSDKLTKQQKMHKLGKEFDEIAEKIGDIAAVVLPKLVEQMGEQAPKIAGAFVKGFLNAPIFGQLLLGAWLLSKMGGLGAATTAGRLAGMTFGRAFGVGMVLSVPLWMPELVDELAGGLNEVLDDLGIGDGTVQPAKPPKKYGVPKPVETAQGLATQSPGTGISYGHEVSGKPFEALQANLRKTRKELDSTATSALDFQTNASRQFERLQRKAGNQLGKIPPKTQAAFAAARAKAERETAAMSTAVGGNFLSLAGSVALALTNIRTNTNNALGGFGADLINFVVEGAGSATETNAYGAYQRGGFTVPGKGSGDTFGPVGLQPGSFVLNRKATAAMLEPGERVFTPGEVAKVGRGNLDKANKAVPRFAEGGEIPHPRIVGPSFNGLRGGAQKGVDTVWEKAKAYLAKNSISDLDSVTRLAQTFGLGVTSGYRAGDDGWHGVNRARDYSNGSGPTPEMMAFAQRMITFAPKLLELIYTPLGKAVKNGAVTGTYAEADHYNHVHVAMQGGGLVGLQKGSSKYGNPKIGDHWIHGSAADSPMGSRWSVNEAYTLLRQIGVPKGPADQLARKVPGESDGYTHALGDDAAAGYGNTFGHGLWQITSGYHDDKIRRFAPINNPINNARAAWAIYKERVAMGVSGISGWYAPSVTQETHALSGMIESRKGKPGKPAPDRQSDEERDAEAAARRRAAHARRARISAGSQILAARGLRRGLAGFDLATYPTGGDLSFPGEQSLLAGNVANLMATQGGLSRQQAAALKRIARIRERIAGINAPEGERLTKEQSKRLIKLKEKLAIARGAKSMLGEQAGTVREMLAAEMLGQRGNLNLSRRLEPMFAGFFARGGVVPGPAGAPRTIVAHGGETVTPAGQPLQITFVGDLGDHIRTEVGRGVKVSDRKLGRKARQISFSPGR